jgi:hypothetical protein
MSVKEPSTGRGRPGHCRPARRSRTPRSRPIRWLRRPQPTNSRRVPRSPRTRRPAHARRCSHRQRRRVGGCDRVRQTDAAPIESDQPRKRAESGHGASEAWLVIHGVDRDEPLHDDEQVARTITKDLVRDIRVAALRVLDLAGHDRSLRGCRCPVKRPVARVTSRHGRSPGASHIGR